MGDILVDFRIRFTFEQPVEAMEVGDPEGSFRIEREIAILCETTPDTPEQELRAMASYVRNGLLLDEAIVVVPRSRQADYQYFSTGKPSVLSENWIIGYLKRLKESSVAAPANV